MDSDVIENLSTDERAHRSWVSDYRTGIIGERLGKIMDRLFREADMAPGSHVLDAGCGTGANTERLLQHGLRVTGIDFSEFAVAEAKQALRDRATIIQGSLTQLPFPDKSFDHVLVSGVLMHVPDIESALDEVIRVLRPGGKLMLTEGSDRSPEFLLRRLFRIVAKTSYRLNPTPSGLEVWTEGPLGPLLARRINEPWLKRRLATRGVKIYWQGVGFLTDLFLTFRHRPTVARLIIKMNDLWFRLQPRTRYSGDVLYVFQKV